MTLWNYALSSLGASGSSGGHQQYYGEENAIDGNDNTWGVFTGTSKYLTIDLGSPQVISDIVLKQLGPSGYYATAFELAYSNNGVDWNAVASYSGLSSGTITRTFGDLTGRYWKVTAVSGAASGWTINTFEVLGAVPAPPPIESPLPEYVNAWLDSIDDNIRPIVDDWLADHGY